jgi:ABC-type spermidine/putrescine transport system permease subunit II
MLGLDQETLIDLLVNVIPMAVILFFLAYFTLVYRWPLDPFTIVVGHMLLVIPLVLLGVLSFVAGRAIQAAEHEPAADQDAAAECDPVAEQDGAA